MDAGPIPASSEIAVTGKTTLAWGFVSGVGLFAAGVGFTFLLAAFLQSRAEVRQNFAAAAGARQTLAWQAPTQPSHAPSLLRSDRVLFTPDLVAGR